MGDGYRAPPAGGIRFAQAHAVAFQSPHLAVTVPRQHLGRCREIGDVDAFRLGIFDLFLRGGHLQAGAAVEDGYLLRPAAQGGAGSVDSGIASADHRHVLADLARNAQVNPAQEIDPGNHPFQLFSRDVQAHALVRTDGDKDRFIAFFPQVFDRKIRSQLQVGV